MRTERPIYNIFKFSHLSRFQNLAGFSTFSKSVEGCRGFVGPVPPPLLIRD